MLACLLLAGCGGKEETPAKPVVEVKVARAETATVRLSVEAPATIFPLEQASIAGRINAPIRAIRARKGDRVSVGQVVAEIENRDLLAQRQEAAAAVADARASLEKTTAGTGPTDLEHARGQVATTEGALNQAQKIYERRQQLFKEGAIAGRDLLIAETDLARAKTEHEVAVKSLDLLKNHSGAQDVQMARSRLDQAEARLANASAQLQFTEIRSPLAGTVTEQFMYPGDMAQPNAPILTLMDLSVAVARAQVPEARAAAVREGQACSFTPGDAPDARFFGRVSMVNQAVDAARRTIEVWCRIPNPKGALRANVFGNAAIETGEEPASVVVPQAAVQFVEGTLRGTVLVVDEKRIAHLRQIEAGQVRGGKVQIKSGLTAGELVVVEGGYGAPDGTEVKW
jgi:multidrug efflux pump subunit AcrA (membrane-fusion protein)